MTIAQKYEQYRHMLGLNLLTERATANKTGRFVVYQGGWILWSPSTCAHLTYGAIFRKYDEYNRHQGFLGFPTTDHLPTPTRPGAYQHFQGGSVYWSADSGAHIIRGALRDAWAAKGWENSDLGFPTTDEILSLGRTWAAQRFQGGNLSWSKHTGVQPGFIEGLEELTDRCSGDVILSNHLQGSYRTGLLLSRTPALSGDGRYSPWSRIFKIDNREFRWHCRSTASSFWASLDPGTWRIKINEGYFGAECEQAADGALSDCHIAEPKFDVEFSSSAVDGWYPEKSTCPEGTTHIRARLGPDRLLTTECLRTS
jgi:hypothetical protein